MQKRKKALEKEIEDVIKNCNTRIEEEKDKCRDNIKNIKETCRDMLELEFQNIRNHNSKNKIGKSNISNKPSFVKIG